MVARALILLLLAVPVGAAQELWTDVECARLGGCSLVPTQTLQDILRQHEELQMRFQRLAARKGMCT